MASITIKNLPPELHQKLKAIAKQGGRSLNQEILQQLRLAAVSALGPAQLKAELANIARYHRQLLAGGFHPLCDGEVAALIQAGRKR